MKPNLIARTCILAVALALAATPAFAKLAAGAAAPDFFSACGARWQGLYLLTQRRTEARSVVVYFYPKAFTRGCTIEANLFAEATAEFAALGATVIGVSADGVLKEFSTGPCGANSR